MSLNVPGASRTSCRRAAVFAQDGYNRATVDAIARHADLGKGTLYLYFDTKEAILAELTLQALGELGEQLQATVDRCYPLHPDLRLRAMADAYLAFALHAPDYFRLLNAFDHAGLKTACPRHSGNRF